MKLKRTDKLTDSERVTAGVILCVAMIIALIVETIILLTL